MPRQIRFLLLVLCAGSLSGQLSERFTATINVGYGLVNSVWGSVNAITTDTAGNVYVLSDVESNPANNGIMFGSDIRVTKLDSAGNVIFSEQFGGSGSEHGAAVTTDKSGAVYVAGTTASADFTPTVPVEYPNSNATLFVLKLDGAGHVQYLSRWPTINPVAIAVDDSGALIVAGKLCPGSCSYYSFNAPPFTTPGAFQTTGTGAQVAKIDPTGSKMVFSTLLGGSKRECQVEMNCPETAHETPPPPEVETANAVGVDGAGNIWVAGATEDVNFPVTADAFQSAFRAHGTDTSAFISELSSDGARLIYSTYLGGTSAAVANAIVLNATGETYVAGTVSGSAPIDFPLSDGAMHSGTAQPGAVVSRGFLARFGGNRALMFSTYLTDSLDVIRIHNLALQQDGSVDVGALSSSGARSMGLIEQIDSTGASATYSITLGRYAGDAGFAETNSGIIVTAGSRGLILALDPAPRTDPAVFVLTDAATLTARAKFAPGELISLFGTNLGPPSGSVSTPVSGFVPTQMAGTAVYFDGIAAPLLYVSDRQINAVVPYEVADRPSAEVQVVTPAGTWKRSTNIVPADPQIFSDANGAPMIINQDGTINSPANRALQGSIVTLFATGAGLLANPPATTGQISSARSAPVAGAKVDVYTSNTLESAIPTVLTYCGAAPTRVSGVLQINFIVPRIAISQLGSQVTVRSALRWATPFPSSS